MRTLAFIASTIALLGAAPAAGAAAKGSCKALHGRDLAPARAVKLVRRGNDSAGTDLLGCVLPRGRVRRIESSDDSFTYSAWYRLRQVAGPIVLTESGSGNQYGSSHRVGVTDLRTGRRYTIMSGGARIENPGPAPPLPAPVFVNARGGAIAVFRDPQTIVITGFSPAGRRRILASVPAAHIDPGTVRLAGRTVSWVQQGRPATATLPD